MCGIAGRFNFRSQAPVDRDLVESMCDLLAHRGPDGSGVHIDGPVGLGHRRLAVIDLSEAGRQPMSLDGDLWITYNGEIYNFQALRTELEALGHRFRSRTDTEVILAAYRQWGTECVTRLRGMFAFAIWDSSRRTLLLARDRVGKKPLQYWVDQDGIAFASEPKAFLADPGFQVRPDPEALAKYLALHYVPAPLSAFSGVQKLLPAHILVVRDGTITVERYWRLRYTPKRRLSEPEATDELLDRLKEAVRLRLISDVPLGAFLSGGIDSGLIVALMASEGRSRVKTFSIGFDERRYSELSFARMVAERYGTDHQEFVVRPDAVEVLPDLVWHYNEPYGDSSAVPTYYLSKLTRAAVTVALTGDGGDENFAGYDRYRANALAAHFDRLPLWLRRTLATSAARLPELASSRALVRARRFITALAEPRERRYGRWVMRADGSTLGELCSPDFLNASPGADADGWLAERYRESDATDFIDATLDVDVGSYLSEDLLVKMDIASMAHGLEARSPLLDHEVMEFAASLPSSFKLRGRTQKWLLKQAAAPLLPAAIRNRPKQGFGVPIDVWFREELRDFSRDILLGSAARQRGYFQMSVVERLLKEHAGGVRQWHHLLWSLVMFELWHQRFVDARPRNHRSPLASHRLATTP